MYISVTEYLMGRAEMKDLSDELVSNLNTIVPRANTFLEAFGEYRKVNSGYRTPAANKAAGGARRSNHMKCAAVDLEDADGKLYLFARNNVPLLEEIGLWCEVRQGGWLHLQIFPPGSGRRFFHP